MSRKASTRALLRRRPELLQSFCGLENFVNKGPLIKLMRWFSVFEGCQSWQGDFFATRMVLESKLATETETEAAVPAEPVQENADTGNQKLDERQL